MPGLGLLVSLAVASTALVPGVPTGSGNTHLSVRPASIYLGDISGSTLSGARSHSPIAWRTWTGSRASGSGVERVNLCRPDCAAGHYRTYPVSITLSRPGTLAGRRLFKSLELRYTSRHRPSGTRLTRWVAEYVPAQGRARAYYWWASRQSG